ncbi:hypothetical protein Rhe02_52640 [Rhizocola hellebori]|uniref:Uncharacterized protein n=1 Tax=Rhizocola hellebori TaxID=1392758 RepID=A0A8J3VIB2_9ACTN|nr:hypothetical protein Rhe02_52640 [Rhizocola hellebori]
MQEYHRFVRGFRLVWLGLILAFLGVQTGLLKQGWAVYLVVLDGAILFGAMAATISALYSMPEGMRRRISLGHFMRDLLFISRPRHQAALPFADEDLAGRPGRLRRYSKRRTRDSR